MSQRDFEAVIGRAVLDAEFRLLLFSDPPGALVEYELLESEEGVLKMIDAESIDACAEVLRPLATRVSALKLPARPSNDALAS